MAKRYTAEEIKQKNFKRITGMNQKEYGEKVARDQLAKQKTFEAPKTEAPNYEKASPDYKFTAEKPKAALNYNSVGVSSVANAEEYDRKKALYDEAVTEANKRAVSDIMKKDQQGETVKGLPLLTSQPMINEIKPLIKEPTYHSGKLAEEARAKEAAEEYERQKELAKKEPIAGAIANIGASIYAPMSYVAGVGNVLARENVLDENSILHQPAKTVQATQQGLTEGKSDTAAFLINTGLSIGQNLARLPMSILGGPTGQVLSLVSMASSAAGQTVYEAAQRGATGDQALLLGTVAGGIEFLTEKIPLDNLFKLSKDSVRIFSKEAAKGIVRQIVSEGGEEMISEITNIIADSIIMGDKSEMSQMYHSFLEAGMSEKDASLNTLLQTSLQISLAGLGGALSGGVLGGGGTVVGAVNRNLGSETQAAVKDIGVENLIAEGKTYEGTAAQKLAQNAEKKISDGKKVSAYAKGQLYNENRIANDEQLKEVEKTVEKAKAEEMKSEAKTEASETANGFTFEKAEEPKIETKLPKPYEATAVERFNALGVNGRRRYSEIANNLMDENGSFDENSFARDFERAYVLGHLGVTEQQTMQHLNIDVSSNPILNTAFNSGREDRTAELTAAQQKVQQGISVSDKVGLERNDIANSLSPKSFSVWDKVGKQLGIKIQLVDNIDGNKNAVGHYGNGVIQVNVKGDRPMWSIAAHEVTHRIKEVSPKAFEAFKSEVVSALGSEYENRYNEVAKRYRTTGEKTNADIEEEVLSEYAEELFDSEEKFEQLANKNSGLAERLIEAFKEFIGKIKAALGKGTSAETNQLDSIVKAWENAYSRAVKTVGKADTLKVDEQKGKYALSKSIEDMSAEELSEAYTESIEERQAIASYLKDGAAVPTATKTRSMTKELLNEFGSNYDVENASALVHNLYMELSTGFDKDGNKLTESEIDSHIERTAKRFIKASTETNTDLFEESKPMRQKIRNTEILISENDIEDFGSREDFNEFKKSSFGRMPKLKVTDTAGNVDKVYQELSSEYPDFFSEDITHPADQLKVISNVFDLVQPTETYLYEDSEETAVKNMSNAIYDSWFMYNHDNKTRAAIDNLHQKKLLEWRKEAHRIQKRAQKIYAEVREQGRQEIKEEIQKVKDNVKKAREIRTRNAMEKAIVGAVKWLNRNRKLIGAEEALAKIDSEVGEIIKPLVGDIPKGKTVVETLQNFLDKYLKANKDIYFVDAIQEYSKRGINNKLTDIEKLEEILELVQMARHDVKTAHEQFLKDRDGNYFEIAKNVIDEIANANGIKNKESLLNDLAKLQMSPYVFFRYISGYADNSALQSLFSEMLEAENKSLLLAREGFEQFASLVGTSGKDKDLRKKRKDFDEKIITVKLGGRYIETTPAFVVALKLHTENPQNMAALLDGVKMPDIKTYLKGNKRVAWSDGVRLIPTLDEINEAYNKLDDYAKSWRGVYKSFSDYWAKNHLNEASEKALGIKIASVDNYIHIRRDPDFLNSSFESIMKSENGRIKIQNSGALKDRIPDTREKPMLLESLTDVIQDQIRLVSEYAGKIEVLTKADKIFNAQLEDGRTFSSVLDDKYGPFGKDYLFKFISDYNGGSKAKTGNFSKLAKGFRGNFAKYVLGANITTAAVQSTAALNGAAEFGWDNYVKSLGRKRSLTLDDIKPYTARATARESGYINTELADKMSSIRLFDQADKISNFFMKGIAISDRKAINSILKQAQTYVETTQPDLKYASKEYYEAVVRAFDRAVNLTQQGNTIALRPEMFRTDSDILRIMGMFSSEAVKNGNLILDGYLNYQAKRTAYKNNQSSANKEALIKAKTEYANKVTSVVAVNIVSAVAVSVLKALFKGQWDKYFDEEGFPTPTTEGLLNTFGDFMESMVSSVVFGKYLAGLTEAVIKGGKAVFEFVASDDPDKELSSSDFTTTIKQTMEETVPELDLIVSFFTKGWNAATSLIEAFAVQSDEAVSNAIRDGDKLFVSFMALLGLPAQNFKTFVLGTADTVTRIPQFIDNSIGIEARYDLLKVRYNAYSTAHRKYFYDLLYQAYLLDDRTAYRNIRRDLLEKGYTHQALDSAIEKRRKEDREKQRKK